MILLPGRSAPFNQPEPCGSDAHPKPSVLLRRSGMPVALNSVCGSCALCGNQLDPGDGAMMVIGVDSAIVC